MKLTSLLAYTTITSSLFAVDFHKDIKPILESQCIKCHGPKKDKGSLRLDTLEASLKGGDEGEAIVPGKIEDSILIERIGLPHDDDDIMPPKGEPLNKTQIEAMKQWIKAGAKWPKALTLKDKSTDGKKISSEKTAHIMRGIGHRILTAGNGKIAILDKYGKIEWQYKIGPHHDLHYLANGNILTQRNMQEIIEIHPKSHKIIWTYNAGLMNGNKGKRVEIHAFQRLENGHTMIVESGTARIIEVDSKGKIHKEIKLKVNHPHPHKDTRLARKLENGHYLVSHEGDGFIREYDPQGKVVWEYQIPLFGKAKKGGHGPDAWGNSSFACLRLKNGNTLIATGNGHSVLEVSPEKEIVWHLKQNDIPGVTLAWVTTLQVLENGNYVIGNCHAGPENPQIIEITRDKELIWQFKDFPGFGNSVSNSLIIKDQKADEKFFAEKVHPILEKNCFECHGHDEKHMKSDFWLASRVDLLKGGDLGMAVNLQKPAQSRLLHFINHLDPEMKMPFKKKKLMDSEIAILTEWIQRGAPYQQDLEHVLVKKNEVNEHTKKFWAYQPEKMPAIPKVNNEQWASNNIDKFILAKLENKGLSPAEKADKQTLIRRAYYDLIGLAPSQKQIDDFIADKSPQAFEKVLDQLLASKHYGEKWGRHWLDLVRYAETNGYERDGNKPQAWQYRQWVIDAFNKDKGYDQMIMEQLAGDELDNPTRETITATGYYRLGVFDDEPADRLQSIYDGYDDVLKTTTEVFMGMTVGCARCHSHKIDPIPMENYYGMLAFFHNIKPYSRSGHENSILSNVISPERKKQVESQNVKINTKRQVVLKEVAQIEQQLALKSQASKSDIRKLKFRFYRSTWSKLPDFDMIKAEEEGLVESGFFDISQASRKTAFGYVFEGKLQVAKKGIHTFYLNSDDGARLTINGKQIIEFDGIHGFSKKDHANNFSLTAGEHDIKLEYFQNIGGLGLKVMWSGPGFKNRHLSLPENSLNAKSLAKVIKVQGKQILGQERFAHYNKLKHQLNTTLKLITVAEYVLAVREKGNKAGKTHLLIRGSAHAKGAVIEPHFPIILTDTQAQIKATPHSSGRRRALAEWLVNESPMTSKVMVNRIWQYHFGRGIVRSANDFGNLGDRPTHENLLHYLSVTFRENDWSWKKMHKHIMLSSSYQMSSKANKKALKMDPRNNLFWRFNMRRLTSEEVRDSILAATGKLNLNYGGSSVYPKISDEVLASQSKITWPTRLDKDPNHQYRRSVYTFTKRSLILPVIESFDGATTDSSCAVRFQTTTPTQSLSMINSDFINQAADDFHQRLKKDAGDSEIKKIQLAWQLITSSQATPDEIKIAQDFISTFTKDNGNNDKAWQQFCLIMLNLNEFIYLD
ncbi:DUF1549 domain-containing protein [Lentisphaera profundi]|uniref:DUF1549 domain-containing protein n=1 Tax=Lentisphaera profundi TaxID=1658616 RepID=A0ABY7VRB6_9BACT|nr:DUF1553 domain-containing protein [Lentisphaera profundi]WDE95334.1 DUF1549 domain-containing protein [Lentisphaera profundi]